MNERQLQEIGFSLLHRGTLVYIDTFNDEITDIVIATRVTKEDGFPLRGYMFEGYDWAEYTEDIERIKEILML